MAIVNYESGDLVVEIRRKTIENALDVITNQTLDVADYNLDLGGLTLYEFRIAANAMFTQFVADIVGFSTFESLNGGDTWLTVRTKLETNFRAILALLAG